MNARVFSSDAGGARRPGCPVCGRPAEPASRPFCSPRCADVDLGRWLTGQYRIPEGAGSDAAEEGPPEPDPEFCAEEG